MKSISKAWGKILAAGGAGVGLAAALVVAAPGASAAEPYPTPAIAVAGGNSVIATQTSQDGLLVFSWADDNGVFHREMAAPACLF